VIDHVRLLPPQIGQHGIKGREIAVNVRNDRNAHGIIIVNRV